jgi:hypothetical protein
VGLIQTTCDSKPHDVGWIENHMNLGWIVRV